MAEDPKSAQELLNIYKLLNIELDKQIATAKASKDFDEAKQLALEKQETTQKAISELQSQYHALTDDEKKQLNDIIKSQKDINEQVKKEGDARRAVVAVLNQYTSWLKQGWQYLMQSDKVIKSTILSLGMSGTKAAEMRLSFEQSADYVAKLGGSIEDVGKIMQGFADETGQATTLSADMVKNIEEIGKGTGLGIEQATKLAGQFKFMGLDALNVNKMVQGIVDTSERMGVNTTKVLKNLSDNFKKLNAYTFLKGSQGMTEMAINAEKTRVSIEDTLTVAEKGRTLEGAIDMMAQLQVMGGAFAQNDPLQWLHDTRNDPEKITEQISQMTKGIVSLRKVGDGTFQKFISPADIDRLEGVAKALGMTREELVLIAQKRSDLDAMDRSLGNKGLTNKEKTLVEGAATFNNANAKYEVVLSGKIRDIATLTREEAQSFAKQQVLLKDRARDAMTFEEVFKATMNELKSALLPLLNVINGVLVSARPMIDWMTKILVEGKVGWLKVATAFAGVGILWKGILGPMIERLTAMTVGKMATFFRGGVAKTIEGGAEKGLPNAGAGAGMLKGGAGIGAAALGVGAGIGIAAEGIGALAKAIKDIDVDKLKLLNGTIAILGGTFVAILVPAMFALGAAGPFAALALAAVGAAAVGVGFGINLAARGIGAMATGFASMLDSAKGVAPSLGLIAKGIIDISSASIANAEGMSMFTDSLRKIGKSASGVAMVGEAFKEIDTVLSGSKENYEAVLGVIEKISKLNVNTGSVFGDLASLLKNPLKVAFDDARAVVNTVTNIVLDGNKLVTHNVANQVAIRQVDMRNSKA